MPSVPRYNELSVTPRALPGARQERAASSEMFGGGDAENFSQLGRGLQKAGGDLADIAVKMADRANADKLFQAETAFKEELIQFDTAQRAKRGAAALADGGITTQAEKWFGETVQKHAGNLENDVQRRLFGELTGKMRLQTLDSMSKHQANEARVSLTDSTNASIVASINRAAANPNDWTVADAERNEVVKRVAALAQINGYTPEVQETLKGEKLTLLHKQMIQQLVVASPAAAKTYFDKYKEEIDGAQRAEIGQFAEKAAATSIGDAAATAVWEKSRPKNSTEPVRLADMEQEIRTSLKGNDTAVDQALKGLKERVSAYEFQKKQEGNALEASVNGLILKGASAGQVRASPEFLQLSVRSPEDARKVLTFLESQAYTREARAEVAERRRDARLGREGLETTLKLSDPDRLVALTRDEVINLLPTLGTQNTVALLNKHDALTKSETKLIEARIDKQDFDTIALEAGMQPNEKAKSEADKDRLVRLQQRVETVIDAEQRARGNKQLTREEKQNLMRREIDNAVMVNEWGRDPRRPLGTLSPDELGKAYVNVDGKEVKLMDIPAKFREQAVAARRRQGLPTTEQTLAQLWLQSQAKK